MAVPRSRRFKFIPGVVSPAGVNPPRYVKVPGRSSYHSGVKILGLAQLTVFESRMTTVEASLLSFRECVDRSNFSQRSLYLLGVKK